MPDLTTLSAVKAWLNNSNSDTDDMLLSSLISQVSGIILSYISRPDILKRQYTEIFSGSGQCSKMLRNFPVIAVSSVNVGRFTIPAGDGCSLGYWADADEGVPPGRLGMVHLNGYRFERQPCKIVYEAGYVVSDEPQTASTTVTALAPDGSWARDEGVTYADGRPMTQVPANPAAGQYALNTRYPGQYAFAAADAGLPVLLTYSYIPYDLERACISIVTEQYRYRDRPGQISKNISGEVISFSLADMPNLTKLSLQPFRRLVPV